MYQEHFGLTALPFGETVDPSSLVALPSREAARRRLRYGLEHGHGPALLFGPPGSGKTVVAAALGRELGGQTLHLTFPAMPADELLAFLADELDGLERPLNSHHSSPGFNGSLRRLRWKLAASAKRGRPILLIVDEAHLIDDPNTFEALRLLQNFATQGPPDLRLLLVGAPEVLLKLPPSLTDRLTARYSLGPLSQSESATYVLGRLEAVTARPKAGRGPRTNPSDSPPNTPLFSSEQLGALHRLADGLPRRLNRLADLALLLAFAEGLPHPDAQCLEIAAREAAPDPLAT